MAGSLLGIRDAWVGPSGPTNLFSYYQGGSYVGLGAPSTIPESGPISILELTGSPNYSVIAQNYQDQGNQPETDGVAYSVEYDNYGGSWGLIVTVCFFGTGRNVTHSTPFGSYSIIKITSANSDLYGTQHFYSDQGDRFGAPYANYNDSTRVLSITGGYGTGGSGDPGYNYAITQVRNGWHSMAGGGNTISITIP